MNCISFLINKFTKIYVFPKGLYNSGVENMVDLVPSLKNSLVLTNFTCRTISTKQWLNTTQFKF